MDMWDRLRWEIWIVLKFLFIPTHIILQQARHYDYVEAPEFWILVSQAAVFIWADRFI
jgi:hypothetical protein